VSSSALALSIKEAGCLPLIWKTKIMRFRLTKKSAGKSLTKFHVLDERDSIVGSINVPNAEANDLLRCWSGPEEEKINLSAQPGFRRRLPPVAMNRAGILRGCNG
jgi:hypothetical protein